MRYVLSLVICWLFCFVAQAQTTTSFLIKGLVKDSSKNTPLPYTTVTIKSKSSGEALKTVVTNENGSFELMLAKDSTVLLTASQVGYGERERELIFTGPVTDVGTVYLSAIATALQGFTITATRPLVKQEADRLIFDVQADPESKVNTVLDMLRKVPLLSVDGTDNIKLKGSSNYKILINGKPSALLARNPADIFRAMPATNIIKIEVITTPPAKYDAEGLAGIINVITKKNADQGYSGSINTRYNSVYGPGINLNATWKQGKFGLNGFTGFNRQNRQTTQSGYTSTFFHPVTSSIEQEGVSQRQNTNTFGNAELSFEVDTLNLLTGSVESFNGTGDNSGDQLSRQLSGNYILAQQYRLFNEGSSGYRGIGLSVNYEHGFKRNKEQLLTTSYKYNTSRNTQNNNSSFTDRINYTAPGYRQYNNSGTKEQTMQVDYVHPLKSLDIEGGAKAILRNNYSLFTTDYYNEARREFINDPWQTNDFTYRQNVYSLYNSYQVKLKWGVIKGGLRLEHTTVNADFASTGSTVKQKYNNLVPSLSLQRNLKNNQSLTLGFSQRIERPGIWQLNPFIDRSNPKYINVGNPELEPVVNRNIELGYSNFKKGSFNAGISYAFADNTVENVTSVGIDTVTTTTYQNVGSNRGLSFDVNTNYPFTSKLNVNINAQLLHVWLKGTYNNQFYNQKGFQGHLFTYTTYKFGKGYRASVNFGFDSRYVLLQGRDNYYIFSSAGGSKTFLKEKATLSLYVNNPVRKYIRLDFYTTTPDFRQVNYNDQYYRTLNISFNYKFGKLSSSIKKNQRGISNDDVNGGRSRQ